MTTPNEEETPTFDVNVSISYMVDGDGNPYVDVYWANQDELTLANLATVLNECVTPLFKQVVINQLVKRGKDNPDENTFIFKALSVWSMLQKAESDKEDELVVKPTEALNLRRAISNENVS
jgi:hypothetical protein